MKRAVIILFHGSRAPASGETARAIAAEVRRRGQHDLVVEAFLQHGAPGLRDAIRSCVHEKAKEITIVPFFLQTGMHVTADIPALVKEEQKLFPDVQMNVTEAVGTHPLMVDVVVDLAGKGDVKSAT